MSDPFCFDFTSFPQSSGSGSESGIQTQKSAKSKSVEMSENNADSNDEAENGSFDLDDRDGSDNGSGTQVFFSSRLQFGVTLLLVVSCVVALSCMSLCKSPFIQMKGITQFLLHSS